MSDDARRWARGCPSTRARREAYRRRLNVCCRGLSGRTGSMVLTSACSQIRTCRLFAFELCIGLDAHGNVGLR